MRRRNISITIVLPAALAVLLLSSCNTKSSETMKMLETDQLIPWCIVPFDANYRTPLERAEMLNELGMSKLAYDYRDRHLPLFEEEIKVLHEHNIELSAVWFWIQEGEGQLLDSTSEFILSTIEKTGTETSLWVSFPDSYFSALRDDEKLKKAVSTIGQLNERVEKAGCNIALYNHGDWFGEPENQVKIIQALGSDNISMVYNFHHGHHHIERFNELVPLMLPYLSVLNLNGMNEGGPKILDIGKGEEELWMLKAVIDAGYKGEFGFIGHTEGEDIKIVLQRNLQGLEILRKEL
ncbi:AP endonuclease [Bacteroidota bacterium]